MSGIAAGRHVGAARRWLPYALTAATLAALGAMLVAVVGRGPIAGAPQTTPATFDGSGAGGPARGDPGRGALVPEAHRAIEGLRPPSLNRPGPLRDRLDRTRQASP